MFETCPDGVFKFSIIVSPIWCPHLTLLLKRALEAKVVGFYLKEKVKRGNVKLDFN
jgi:hypothetical protein